MKNTLFYHIMIVLSIIILFLTYPDVGVISVHMASIGGLIGGFSIVGLYTEYKLSKESTTPPTIDRLRIESKIEELRDKKWKTKEEYLSTLDDNGHLTNREVWKEREVKFGNQSLVDVYDHGRFDTIATALVWALNDEPEEGNQ